MLLVLSMTGFPPPFPRLRRLTATHATGRAPGRWTRREGTPSR